MEEMTNSLVSDNKPALDERLAVSNGKNPHGLADVMSKILKKGSQKPSIILAKGQTDRELSRKKKAASRKRKNSTANSTDSSSDSSGDEQDDTRKVVTIITYLIFRKCVNLQ